MEPEKSGQKDTEHVDNTPSAEEKAKSTSEKIETPETEDQPVVSGEDAVEPVADAAETVADAAEAVEDTAETVEDAAAETVADAAEAVEDTAAETVADAAEAVEETAETVEDAAETTEETTTDASSESDDSANIAVEPETDAEAAVAEATAKKPPTEAARPEGSIARGDLIEGVISETTPTSITVDLGNGNEGLITDRELERMGRKSIEHLVQGERLLVYVVNPNDHEGRIILSVNRAIEEMDWKNATTYHESQEIYEGNIAGYNKGGLIVRFGRLRGFVPQSQISDNRARVMSGETPEERFSGMVNEKIYVKVMEVDRSRNRLILSERQAARDHREQRKEELIDELAIGEVREGTVVSLEDFGAFVDIGGAEGLVHLTEIAWKHINHPREVLNVGQKVRTEVISVDPRRKRIGLSIKRQEADPWDEVATTYQVGDLVQATVTKLTKFGAFARLLDAEDIEGLIHISELSDDRVAHPREVVNEGEKLTLRVVKIDVKNRRLGMSLKRVDSAEYLDRDLKTFASESDE